MPMVFQQITVFLRVARATTVYVLWRPGSNSRAAAKLQAELSRRLFADAYVSLLEDFMSISFSIEF